MRIIYPIFVYLWRHQYNESDQKQGYSHARNSDLKITGIILVHCSIVNNEQDSKVLYKFDFNKLFGQLLHSSPNNFIFLKTFLSEFSYIEVWFTDQNSKSPEIEDKI